MNQFPVAHRDAFTVTANDVLSDMGRQLQDADTDDTRTLRTGFDILDEVLGGGLQPGELIIVGGTPGVGKTIMALQMARSIAASGQTAMFVCYEHGPETLTLRLLELESAEAGGDAGLGRTISREFSERANGSRSLEELLQGTSAGTAGLAALREYGDRLSLVAASGSRSTIDAVRSIALANERPSVIFIDYLQKIPLHPEPLDESEKVTRTVEALKDLALQLSIPIVLISAVDVEGMRASRLRMFHLRGSAAIAFEADVVLMLNEKMKAVSRVHLTYDAARARQFRDWIVVSIEKNRGGPSLVDLEFRKDFSHYRFDPEGGVVAEKLVSERLDETNI